MKIAKYLRVSKRLGMTVENQLPALDRFQKEHPEHEFTTFTDHESTRKTRPERQRVDEQLRSGELDGVICIRLDRFLRSLKEVVFVQEMIDKGKYFNFLNNGLELSTEKQNATARMQLGMLGVFAEFERDLIRERTIEGLADRKARGKKLGRPAGSKDKNPRRRSGYWLRWAGKKRQVNKEDAEKAPHPPLSQGK
jgi:DNA invertase Pin-like site-specific DNA recombinase